MLTLEQLHEIMPSTRAGRGNLAILHLQEAMTFCDINTPRRQAAFIGHIAFESAELIGRPKSSLPRDPYETRGWIPMVGKDNYRRMKVFTGADFLRNPDLINTLKWAPWAAGYLWRREGGNRLADQWDLETIVHRFSFKIAADDGERRMTYFNKAAKTLGAQTDLPQVS